MEEQKEMETKDRESILEILKQVIDDIGDKEGMLLYRRNRRWGIQTHTCANDGIQELDKFMRNVRKLSGKNMNISFVNDMTMQQRQKHKELVDKAKLLKKNQGIGRTGYFPSHNIVQGLPGQEQIVELK